MLLSRMASHAFWLGRYLERAEATARAIIAHDRMCLDLPRAATAKSGNSYRSLFVLCGADEEERERALDVGGRTSLLAQLLFEKEEIVGVFPTLQAARENLRSCRVLLPRQAWDTLNPVFLQLADQAENPRAEEMVGSLEDTISACQRISAELSESMIRDEAFAFIRAGRHLERADMLMRVIQVADELKNDAHMQPFADVRWMGLLHSLSAYQMFRRVHRGRAGAQETLRFLLSHRKFPRSLWFSIMKTKVALRSLPHSEPLIERCDALQHLPLPRDPSHPRHYTSHVLSGLQELSDAIEKTYFQSPEELSAAS